LSYCNSGLTKESKSLLSYFAGILVITCNNILCVSWCCQYLVGSLYFLTCKEWSWNSTYSTPLLSIVHHVTYAVSALCPCIPCMTPPIPTNGCVRIWVSKIWFHYLNKNLFSTLHVSSCQLVLDFYSPCLQCWKSFLSACRHMSHETNTFFICTLKCCKLSESVDMISTFVR